GRGAEHVDLIDDIDLELAGLRGEADLFDEGPDIVHGVIAGGIELVDIEGGAFVKGDTGGAVVAGLSIGGAVLAIDGFGEDPGAGGLAYPPGSAKKEGMGQLVVADGVFEGRGDMGLTHYGRKILGSVFSGRNDKFIHSCSPWTNLRQIRRWAMRGPAK